MSTYQIFPPEVGGSWDLPNGVGPPSTTRG